MHPRKRLVGGGVCGMDDSTEFELGLFGLGEDHSDFLWASSEGNPGSNGLNGPAGLSCGAGQSRCAGDSGSCGVMWLR